MSTTTILRPRAATTTAVCLAWPRTLGAYCGSTDQVRLYLIGPRCPLHTPAAVAGQPEPQSTPMTQQEDHHG